ncbi:MAG: HrpE/YscL family type III secretion apparatus protein [Chromatiaceae bacterium]|nr:HrpE/YscL family type III secretion apparatus protein [Chromatiaceae bacterium]MCP5315848.1 HrpE/YscL family type III secretion apparatus protein [Chromatiaceae bacterium]
MVSIVCLKCADGTLPPDTRVLKAAQYEILESGRQVLEEARRTAQEILNDAETQRESERARGYAEGREAARMEFGGQMIDSVGRAVDYFAGVEEDAIGVVLSSLRKILGEFDDHELIRRVVRNALQVVRNQKKVTLRVSPGEAEQLMSGIGEIQAGLGNVGFVEVVPDHRLAARGCILETELGVVEASIETQLKALEEAMKARLGRQPAQSG